MTSTSNDHIYRNEPNPPELHGLFGANFVWKWPDEDESLAGDLPTLMDVDINILPDVRDYQETVPRLAGRPSVCIQAGGAIGAWPKRLAKVFDHVYTFEPYPPSFHCLTVNCPELNVHKYNAALGEARGTAKMGFPEHVARSQTGKENIGGYRVLGSGAIPILRIDDFDFQTVNLDLIMLDLEGFEWMALKGAFRTIAEHRPVIVLEDKAGCCETFGYKVGDCEKWLRAKFEYDPNPKRFHGGRDVLVRP